MGAAIESLSNYRKSQSNLTQAFIPRGRLNSLQIMYYQLRPGWGWDMRVMFIGQTNCLDVGRMSLKTTELVLHLSFLVLLNLI